MYTGLLLVDTSPLKHALVAKAAAGEQALMDQLQSKTIGVARRVCSRCEELSAKALAVSTGVRSVLELKVRLPSNAPIHSTRRFVMYADACCEVAPKVEACVFACPDANNTGLTPQTQLATTEVEVSEMMVWLAASRERDNVRFAYRHPTPDGDVELVTAAQAWPKRMFETLERYVNISNNNFMLGSCVTLWYIMLTCCNMY